MNKKNVDENHNESTDSLFVTQMYFVNWIDNIFELLTNLSNIVYKYDQECPHKEIILWKNEVS